MFDPEIPEAISTPLSSSCPPGDTNSRDHKFHGTQTAVVARTPLPGHSGIDGHSMNAGQNSFDSGHKARGSQALSAAVETPSAASGADESHGYSVTHQQLALVGEITAIYRRYEDLRRARQRIELQGMATCRSVCGGDKVEGAKLYKKPTPQVEVWLLPYAAAMAPLSTAISDQAKLLDQFGKKLPVKAWCDTVAGLSPRFLAMIVGECGIGPGEFRSPAAFWKRMGLAVIGDGRQRKVAGDAAIEHGYVPRRRSLMWNIGESMIKQQVRNPKGEDGKPIGDAVGIGHYGAIYLDRKRYEIDRVETPMHAHNRAKRYMEKRLLRDLWRAWRMEIGVSE